MHGCLLVKVNQETIWSVAKLYMGGFCSLQAANLGCFDPSKTLRRVRADESCTFGGDGPLLLSEHTNHMRASTTMLGTLLAVEQG